MLSLSLFLALLSFAVRPSRWRARQYAELQLKGFVPTNRTFDDRLMKTRLAFERTFVRLAAAEATA